MRRVVVTGAGVISPAGIGLEPLAAALAAGAPLGDTERIPAIHGHAPPMRVARLPRFDREQHIPARALRRMGEISQIWTIACLLARHDAGLAEDGPGNPAPERRALFMGTGFGCIDATWDYLRPMVLEGMGTTSPFLFSESVANAPAGHAAIMLDARGACITLTCGDASAIAAVARAADAIRQERADIAWAGGVEMMVPPLLRVLAALKIRSAGEGAACLVLEEAGRARARGARILAEVGCAGLTSDPAVSARQWPRDRTRLAAAMRRAARPFDDEPAPRVQGVWLQGGPDPPAADAERAAALECFPGAAMCSVEGVTGMYAASGGCSLGAAVHALSTAGPASSRDATGIVSGPSWGGGITCIALRAPSL